MNPKMKKKEIDFIKKALLSAFKGKQSINVLEWGSGGSTVFFTDFLRRNDVNYSWVSLEYNIKWFEKVYDKIKDDSSVELVLFDAENLDLKQRDLPMDEYVKYPETLGKSFDVIIIDGRKRRRCLGIASRVVSDGGVILLHDAHRKYYHCAFKLYKNSRLVQPYLWVAISSHPFFFEKIFNYVSTSYYVLVRSINRYVKSFIFKLKNLY